MRTDFVQGEKKNRDQRGIEQLTPPQQGVYRVSFTSTLYIRLHSTLPQISEKYK